VGGRRGCGPTRQREEGGNGVERAMGGGEPVGLDRRRGPRQFFAGSPVLRRRSGGEARARVGDHGVGPIWPKGAWGGRSTARWRALAAVRLPSAIGGGDGCIVFVRE
jgi:hypothetical protein